jgi:hypothetical protein
MITTLLAPLSPQELLQVAVYVPALFTEIVVPVAFVLHLTVPLQPAAIKVAVSVLQILFLLALMIGAAGLEPVLMIITLLTPLSPQELLQVAVYVPALFTEIVVPVAFVLHLIVPLQPAAIKVAVSVLHKLVLLALTIGAAGLEPVLMITTLLAPLSPQELLQVAVYVPALFTEIDVPVAVVLHLTVPLQRAAIKVAVSVLQILVLLALMIGAAGLVPVLMIIILLTPLTPQIFSQVAVYVPALFTEIVVPVAVVLHLTVPLQPVAVNVAVSVLHKLVLFVAITGTVGLVPVRMIITFDELLLPQVLEQIAV